MTRIIQASAVLLLMLLSGCSVNVHMSPIELSMRKNMQEEIAHSVASAITSQVPEIKKQLLNTSSQSEESGDANKSNNNTIIVDLSDVPAGIKNSFHVKPREFDGLTAQAALLDKSTPLLLYQSVYKHDVIEKALKKLKELGFSSVGVYTGNPAIIGCLLN